eukprot:TRINITY_DN49354_c0_g1_i1.p1 TRINITY_DN49354_c0_g1~~TRINITY_DN49354_c0_g1_i1.p1  ORF type:complete len:112 (+),score=1.79 TRINITY_DN49354_c0_g1_i1:215-550(+)
MPIKLERLLLQQHCCTGNTIRSKVFFQAKGKQNATAEVSLASMVSRLNHCAPTYAHCAHSQGSETAEEADVCTSHQRIHMLRKALQHKRQKCKSIAAYISASLPNLNARGS